MPPTKRPGLRIPLGSSACLRARMIAKPGGGGPQMSSDDFTDAGADATTTWPSSPAIDRMRCRAGAADDASTRRSTMPAAGWMMTEASDGTAPDSVGMEAMGAIARRSTTSPSGRDQEGRGQIRAFDAAAGIADHGGGLVACRVDFAGVAFELKRKGPAPVGREATFPERPTVKDDGGRGGKVGAG